MRLEDEVVRFSIIPDQGTQVWAQLPIVCIFIWTWTMDEGHDKLILIGDDHGLRDE